MQHHHPGLALGFTHLKAGFLVGLETGDRGDESSQAFHLITNIAHIS